MMSFGKQIQNELAEQGEKLVKAASFQIILAILMAGQLLVFWLSGQVHLFPDNDARMTVISCCAQIIAGLYGITLAGYTFFLSRMDTLTATDATLDYIVGSVKQQFKLLIWYITATVAMTLVISVFLMYYPVDCGVIPEYLYRVICNEFVLFMAFSIALILYYSVGVVDPNCLSREARRLKKKLGGKRAVSGNAVEFIALYDQIEQHCNGLLPANVVRQIRENKGKHFEYTIALLQEQHILLRPLIGDLRRIHRYYECMVNCAPMSVSLEMCILAKRVLQFLVQTEENRSVKALRP